MDKRRLMIIMVFAILIPQFVSCQSQERELAGHIGRPDISPDGEKIAFIYAKDADKDIWEVYTSDISGKNVKKLTNFRRARIKKGPVWSPDSKKLAFHADIDDGAQIFIVDTDGGHLTQLTYMEGYNVEPHWSPDGNRIVFNHIPANGKAQMFMMHKDGSNPEKLPNQDGHNWYPRLNTRDEIIFTSDVNQENYYDIFIMDLDGSRIRQLTSVKAINWFPEYSPDESKIVFHSNLDDPQLSDSGNYNLYIMEHDGTGLRRLTDFEGQELHAKWFPSGTKLIFEWHHKTSMGLYTLDLPTNEVKKIKLFY